MPGVKELPLDDRPREKLWLRGPQSLTDAELIAILLRTGTKGKSVLEISREILKKSGSLNLLASKTLASLKTIPGIGRAKSATLIAAFELSRRADSQKKWFSNKKITGPPDIAEIFAPLMRDKTKEGFYVVCLNTANRIIKFEQISEGSLNASVVHAREVFQVAIENNSASIILMHNHPSGNTEPSAEDIGITKKLMEAGKYLDIQVLDHIILGGNKYTSFVEKKII